MITGAYCMRCKTLLLFGLILINPGCTDNRIGHEPLQKDEFFTKVDVYQLPELYTGGEIMYIEKCSDSLLIVSDFFLRELTIFNVYNNTITQLGSVGDGPGEYRHPTFIRNVGNCTIAFSDMTNSNTTMIDKNGNHIKTVHHRFGANRKFDVTNNSIAYLGTGDSLLYIYDLKEDAISSFIEINENYRRLIRHIAGGGIAIHDNNIYMMNSIEPVIYSFDITDHSKTKIIPSRWENELRVNFDESRAAQMTSQRWRDENKQYAVFIHFDILNIDNDILLVIFYYRDNQRNIDIIDSSGTIIASFTTEKYLLGCFDNEMYFYELHRNDDEFDLFIHRYRTK